ncbi:hypothetical protein E3N88_24631 [Mikania micrantha]|uniref:Uncharacterized protein n=1 Tax=Mikania micrantha TaxID=192012 RepID=A0A5N6N3R2_9ASTR|nr:hypothetical protein E3N88_24631 [Mikania micrantha]
MGWLWRRHRRSLIQQVIQKRWCWVNRSIGVKGRWKTRFMAQLKGLKRETKFIETDMSSNVDAVCFGIEAPITMMLGAVPKKYTRSGAKLHFVSIVRTQTARSVVERAIGQVSESADMVLGDSVASSSEMGVCPVNGVWPCPFRGFHCSPDGMAGSKGFPRLIAHIKHLHLSSKDRKKVLREAISTNLDLFTSVGEALKASGQWLCGVCMCLHALSWGCHHEDGLTIFNRVIGDTEEFIVGISKPHTGKEVVSLGGLAADNGLVDRVFSLPITAVKSIPPSCRMVFSHALTAALGKVAATPDSVEACVRLLLLPRCTLRVFRPSNRQEHRSGNRKYLHCHIIHRSLTAWGDEDGFVELILSLLAQPSNETPSLDKPSPSSNNSATQTNVKQCLRKVANGHFTATVKVLCSSGVAPFGNDTLKALVAKHPTLPPPVMPDFLLSEPPLVVDADCVFKCIASFLKGTSCRRDGLRAQHILDAFCGEGSAIASGLLKAVSTVVNLCLAGRCPKILAEYVASAPLTPFLKPDNGIRPIAVGMIWKRPVSKAAMRGVGKEMAKYLGDFWEFLVGRRSCFIAQTYF